MPSRPVYVRKDHPRRCGENSIPRRGRSVRLGSPPQVRGKQVRLDDVFEKIRITPQVRGKPCTVLPLPAPSGITPAGAGKTYVCALCCAVDWDHPRRCGENRPARLSPWAARGSPPQVRGKRYNATVGICKERITPAGAGKTSCDSLPLPRVWDHPRRCGEN